MSAERISGAAGGQSVELRSHGHVRRLALWIVLAALLLAVGVYYETYASMVKIWLRSDTFFHGLLVFPMSAFLISRRWPVLRSVELKPFFPGLLAVFGVSGLWWLCDVLGIQVGKQLMAVALLPLLVLTLTGTAFTRRIAFPLAYLLFAVPFGEAAIPYLMDFTAYFTVAALQLTGIPVLRDGVFFSIPSGDFEVAKACSGIRYTLASLAIGTLYANMTYAGIRKQLAFLLFALLLPIFANGLRAYGIVLLAHYSDMRIAIGVDHLIYGWIFFGLIILLMFWIGDRFRDQPLSDAGRVGMWGASPQREGNLSLQMVSVAAVASLLLAATGPALAVAGSALEPPAGVAGIPLQAGGWRSISATDKDWHPAYIGATAERAGSYRMDGRRVDLAVIRYDLQHQGAELASAVNAVANPREWRFGNAVDRELDLEGLEPLALRESPIHRQGVTRLVWSWNEVNGQPVVGDLDTKLHEAASLLLLERPVSAAIVVSVQVENNAEDARAALEAFLATGWLAVHECLYAAEIDPGLCVDGDVPGGVPGTARSGPDLP